MFQMTSELENDPSGTLPNPITFEDIPGLNIKHEQTTVDTVLGKRRTFNNLSKIELAFVTVSIVSILCTVGLTITRLIDVEPSSVDFVFAVVLLINCIFCFYYIMDGVFFESAYEIVVFIGATLILLIYCIISFTQDKDDTVKKVRFYLIITMGPACFVLGSLLAKEYYESRNLIFRTVGASVELQNMCGLMLFFQTLLKFDLQLEISMVVFVLSDGTQHINTEEIIVLAFGLCYSIMWAVVGFLSVRFESKALVWLFLVTSVAEPAYILYKIIDVIMNLKNDSSWAQDNEESKGLIAGAIITCGFIGLAIRFVTCITMLFVYRNFGKGLKEKVYGLTSGDTTAVVEQDCEPRLELPSPQSI